MERRAFGNNNILREVKIGMGNIKDYEIGVHLKQRTKYILEKSGMTQEELGKVLGISQSQVFYICGGFQPSYNIVQVILKLYRLWYEKEEGYDETYES